MSSDDIAVLAADFAKASRDVGRQVYDAMKDAGQEFAQDWRDIARGAAGTHGKHYPDAITSETKVGLGVIVETGPEVGRKQGGMGRGFEFGSVNQPPHLDGLKAMTAIEPRIARMVDTALGPVLP